MSLYENPSNVEVWEIRWDEEPGFREVQGWIPAWCDEYDNIGGVCIESELACTGSAYWCDHPQFNQRLTIWVGTLFKSFSRINESYFMTHIIRYRYNCILKVQNQANNVYKVHQ